MIDAIEKADLEEKAGELLADEAVKLTGAEMEVVERVACGELVERSCPSEKDQREERDRVEALRRRIREILSNNGRLF